MKRGWENPPSVVVVGGTETYLRDREVQRGIRAAYKKGREVVVSLGEDADSDVVDALTAASTFGGSVLVVVLGNRVSPDLVREQVENPVPGTCMLVLIRGAVKEKDPVVAAVHAGYRFVFTRPTSRSEKAKAAQLFVRAEAIRLMESKPGISPKLAAALVGACGSELGVLAQEVSKASALARSRDDAEIEAMHLRATLRPASTMDIGPLANALAMRNASKVGEALQRMRSNSPSAPPVMLLLRGRGGPADLALRWLQIAVVLKEGASAEEVASRLSLPVWMVQRQDIPAARRWGVRKLRALVASLAAVEQGFLRGSPAPWVALESALFRGCSESFLDPSPHNSAPISVAT